MRVKPAARMIGGRIKRKKLDSLNSMSSPSILTRSATSAPRMTATLDS